MGAAIAGCAPLTGRQQPTEVIYLLQPPTEAPRPAPAGSDFSCRSLLVAATGSAPGYATARMAYVEDAPRLDYFARHGWADTPARMFGPLLVSALEASGAFGGVLMAPSPAGADVRLDTRVLELHQHFDDSTSRVRFSVRASLVAVDSGRLLGARTFTTEEPAEERTPRGGAVAANRATAELLDELIDFVFDRLGRSGLDCRR